jgi:hypothetical protein
MHTHHSHDARWVQAEYGRRLFRLYAALVSLIAYLTLLYMLHSWSDRLRVILGLIGLAIYAIFGMSTWRCPNCGHGFGGYFFRFRCPKCETRFSHWISFGQPPN